MKKKILLTILIVVILLSIGGAYAYFATDAFKTDKEIFFSYISNNNMFEKLTDKKLEEYIKKQEKTPYTNKGEISISAKSDSTSETSEEVKMLNNSKVTFEGKVNNNKKLAEQTLTVDVSLGVNIPIKIKRDGNTFGVQSNLLDSKFIAIKNENLKALCKRFDIESEEIPDKIELSKEQLTKEELTTLKDKYVAILNENLGDELFSKEKIENDTIVTLKMTEKKFLDVTEKLLETTRDDEILADKDTVRNQIDELIKEIKQIDTKDEDTVEIKLYTKSKEIKKIEAAVIEDNNTSMRAVVENNQNQLSIKIYEENNLIGELNIEKQTSGNDLTYIIKMIVDAEGEKAEINLNMQYKNLQSLDNVEESCDLKVSYKEDTEIGLSYKNLKAFSNDDIEIEGLSNSNAIIINDASDEELQNLLVTIFQRLGLTE